MLRELVERYVALHRATGYKFKKQSALLQQYVEFAEGRGERFVVAKTALEWAAGGPTSESRQRRLIAVRRFASAQHAEDQRHEVPPAGTFGPTNPRPTPYIFSPDEVRMLLDAAAAISHANGWIVPKMYSTLFGLLATTGLRISEALALRVVDISSDGLFVRESKFKKSRLVPIHPTTRQALDAYLRARDEYGAKDDVVFISRFGRALHYVTVESMYLRLVRAMGIHSERGGRRRPGMHDLRHTFAVRSLEQCAGDRRDVARHMLALSTYLGHSKIRHTYWYLQATPRLLSQIAAQSEALARGDAR